MRGRNAKQARAKQYECGEVEEKAGHIGWKHCFRSKLKNKMMSKTKHTEELWARMWLDVCVLNWKWKKPNAKEKSIFIKRMEFIVDIIDAHTQSRKTQLTNSNGHNSVFSTVNKHQSMKSVSTIKSVEYALFMQAIIKCVWCARARVYHLID